ncbi:MAG: phosphoenolpyruvate--protein phosphotransferase [Clostridiales bacterium]|nr:phosphoenolpyruvate--protein phosphotransferase [Clostridiales bacterium]
MTIYKGKGVFPGIALGEVFVLTKNAAHSAAENAVQTATEPDAETELNRLKAAISSADRQLEALAEKTRSELGESEAEIIEVQRMMLQDDDFIETIKTLIQKEHSIALNAVTKAGNQYAEMFKNMDDEYMKARALDILDVSARLANNILGKNPAAQLTKEVIIVAEDLTPSETLQMDKSKIIAFVIKKGSENSHTAILAKAMSIPCIVQADIPADASLTGKEMIADGETGICALQPDEFYRKEMLHKKERLHKEKLILEEMRGLASVTKSGKKINLYSNVGSVSDVDLALQNDCEGIGLFRSEFLYLNRSNYPTEDELFGAYRSAAQKMDGKQIIIRTLDIGADKTADYFKLEAEENPALGLRGIRVCIDKPDLFKTQLKAIYRASVYGNIAVMFPMIISLSEVIWCKEQMETVRAELTAQSVPFSDIKTGIMIETPAAVMIADALAKEVDFFSVGTNDLSQYTLAIDRQNSNLQRFDNPLHPAVMEMLKIVARAAKENGIWAGICGELAANVGVTEYLINLGFEELSVSPAFTLQMRKHIRNI